MSKPIPKGTLTDGDMTTMLDSRFLNAIVLQGALEKRGGDVLTVEIDRVEHHDQIKYENGQSNDNVYLLYFKGSDKPLKLSKTNVKRIIGLHGVSGKNWHGKKINLCLELDKRPDLGGKKGLCVRISPINPETGKGAVTW
tara:strand:+ start:141 stop:560 length:420 start_codon:yes stop_codon:yes gene_type:complete